MDVRRAYCSAVDRNVPVILRKGAPTRDRVTMDDPADLICLDYKVRCTGWCCPLFSVEEDTAVPVGGAGPAGRSADPLPNAPEPKSRWARPT